MPAENDLFIESDVVGCRAKDLDVGGLLQLCDFLCNAQQLVDADSELTAAVVFVVVVEGTNRDLTSMTVLGLYA